jgi:hypothetical protein
MLETRPWLGKFTMLTAFHHQPRPRISDLPHPYRRPSNYEQLLDGRELIAVNVARLAMREIQCARTHRQRIKL